MLHGGGGCGGGGVEGVARGGGGAVVKGWGAWGRVGGGGACLGGGGVGGMVGGLPLGELSTEKIYIYIYKNYIYGESISPLYFIQVSKCQHILTHSRYISIHRFL